MTRHSFDDCSATKNLLFVFLSTSSRLNFQAISHDTIVTRSSPRYQVS